LVAEFLRLAVAESKHTMKLKKKTIDTSDLLRIAKSKIDSWGKKETRKVINATGILVHTNLGRAPLGKKLLENIIENLSGYNNLEFDLIDGKRGGRGEACEKYLAILTGAESAAIVNNCAAALFIILNTFANRKKVLLSRGELVQIGGGFRIPEILKRSGAKLEEVGTTNVTNLKDYSDAADKNTSIILKIHKSNFVQSGFTKEVPLEKLTALAEKQKLLLVHDIGSGALIPTRKILGHDEPTPLQSIRSGAHLVCFSADKMLGGIQAGLIAGKKELIDRIKQNPLFRTIRVDKFVISALENIFKTYLDGTYQSDVKLWQLLSVPEGDLYKRAKSICQSLDNPELVSVEATRSFIGGGGLPESALPSVGLCFSKKCDAKEMMQIFRNQNPPVIGRIENDRFILDLKAIDDSELDILKISVSQVLRNIPK
jgi:L-seryl-tRNA(Ser) seleniumtransferase